MNSQNKFANSSKNFSHNNEESTKPGITNVIKKSSSFSKHLRNEGNKFFRQKKSHNKDMHKAILWAYSKSVAYAPLNSEELAAAYSNRSVLLMHLRCYKESIDDIDRALETSKDESLLMKLVSRRADCWKLTKGLNNAVKPLDLNDDKPESLENKKDNVPLNPPSIIPSSVMLSASESVLLKYNQTFGRHFIAARDIKPGEVIVVEEGYVCFAQNNQRYLVCSHCLKFTWNGIACDGCPFAIYCSESCKKEAWQDYHDIECAISPFLTFMHSDTNECATSDIVIALRIFIKAVKKEGLDKILNEAETIDNERDNEIKGLLFEGVMNSGKFRSCYNLSSNVQYNAEKHKIGINSVTKIMKLLLTHTDIFNAKNVEENNDKMMYTQVKIILNKLRHIADVNAFGYQSSICDCINLDKPKCTCAVKRGVIIVPCCSLINHSCSSNVSRLFLPKKKVVVFTVSFVKKGEQLFDSYGPSIRMERRSRQRFLQKNFHFRCMCSACTENWPTEQELDLVINPRSESNIISQVTYEFKKLYPDEDDYFIFHDIEEIWTLDKKALEKAKLVCELIFQFSNDYMTAFLLSRPYRYFIDKVFYKLYGEKYIIPDTCA